MAGLFFEQTDGSEKADPDRPLTENEAAALKQAWAQLITEWKGIMRSGILPVNALTTTYTKGQLWVDYVRARLYGKPMRRTATFPYNPQRILCPAADYPLADVFDAALGDERVLKAIIWALGGNPSLDKLLSVGRTIYGYRLPMDFPADLAKDLINEFCPEDGAILDPCHGWGGRALGYLLAKTGRFYAGFDVAPLTSQGVESMLADLTSLFPFDPGKEKKYDLTLSPFEDSNLRGSSFDFAFTSPPYFDVERYDGEKTSHVRYPTYQKWLAGFYDPFITKVHAALKPGAHFALNVSSHTYPLTTDALRIGKKVGFNYLESRRTARMVAATEDDEDGSVIIIFQKKAEFC